MVYKLYIGTKSATLEKVFNGRVPYGTKRLCFLKDMINREEDSLRVSVEILEAVREIEHTIKPPPPLPENATEEDALTRPLEGKVVLRRHINNRLTEQVKTEAPPQSRVHPLPSLCMGFESIQWHMTYAAPHTAHLVCGTHGMLEHRNTQHRHNAPRRAAGVARSFGGRRVFNVA